MPYTLSALNSLTNEKIDTIVTQTKPGVYVLDKTTGGTFRVSYVGRADKDLNRRLKDWVGKYKYFKFDYATSPKDAFEKECELWHDFGGPQGKLDNDKHPERPDETNWKCPKCKTFE
jgi:hypothetical protein